MNDKSKKYGNRKPFDNYTEATACGFADCSLVVSPTGLTGAVPVAPLYNNEADAYAALGVIPYQADDDETKD